MVPLRRSLRRDNAVVTAMKKLDRQIATLNLKQAVPPPPFEPGRAHYVGSAKCVSCHKSATTFWKQTVHAHAWKEMFDAFLRADAAQRGVEYVEFRLPEDYASYVDGKLRQDGVRSFLASRHIDLPEGAPGDPPPADTCHRRAPSRRLRT